MKNDKKLIKVFVALENFAQDLQNTEYYINCGYGPNRDFSYEKGAKKAGERLQELLKELAKTEVEVN
jgi:hypothetical protein